MQDQEEPTSLANQQQPEEEEEYEESSEDDDIEIDDAFKRNKFEVSEIEDIQKAIQKITKSIEKKKIELRISDERYSTKQREYNELQGKPNPLTEEEKEKKKKERNDSKEHKYDEPKKNYAAKEKLNETARRKFRQLDKKENESESLTQLINDTNLDIEDLKIQIENLRKQKSQSVYQLNLIEKKNEKLKKDTEELKKKNDDTNKKIEENDNNELMSKTQIGFEQRKNFERRRDKLEAKYHKLIEANIERERERKKEQAKKRQLLGMMAANAMNNSKKNKNNKNEKEIEEQIKKLHNEEISDRIPILDVTLDKWKNINKIKKNMLDKYIKNSEVLKEAFDIIMKFLGVNEYDELPIIFEKNEEQNSNIEMYITQLTDLNDEKEENKIILQEQIEELKLRRDNRQNEKQNFGDDKKANIEKLNEKIKEIENDINSKRDFFNKLQPETNRFLKKLNQTYVSDYVPNKIPLDNLKYTEDNVKTIMDNIQNYYKLITQFEKSINNPNKDDYVNRKLDELRLDMREKLENFKKENCMNTKQVKNDLKNSGNNYDETIKKLSKVIVEQANY
jgi:hypothetical protein